MRSGCCDRDLGDEVAAALAVHLRVVEPVHEAPRARLHHLVEAARPRAGVNHGLATLR